MLGGARDRDGRVVLLRAVDVVGKLVVGDGMVELRRGLVLLRRPGLPAVDRDRGTSVVAVDEASGVLRIDPEAMMIAVRSGEEGEALPAVHGAEEPRVQDVHGVRVLRVGEDVREVPRTLPE